MLGVFKLTTNPKQNNQSVLRQTTLDSKPIKKTKIKKIEGYITTSKFDDLISHIAALRFSDFQTLTTERRERLG